MFTATTIWLAAPGDILLLYTDELTEASTGTVGRYGDTAALLQRRPPFVMYDRTGPLHAVRNDLTASGFTLTAVPCRL